MGQEIRDRMDEIFKPYNYFGRTYYISNVGNVKNEFNEIIKQHADRYGYLRVRLVNSNKESIDKRIYKLVHRLVYFTFGDNLDNFKSLTINHKDGNKLNNFIDNLELISAGDNNRHAYRTGLKNNTGENNPRHIRTWDVVNEIRELYKTGKYTQTEVANMFNTKQARVSEIVLNKSWKQ